MRTVPLVKKYLAVALSLFIFTSHSLFAHAAETNFWKERAEAAPSHAQNKPISEPPAAQYASLPASLQGMVSPTLAGEERRSLSTIMDKWSPSFDRLLESKAKSRLSSLLNDLPASAGTLRKISVPKTNQTPEIVLHIQDVHLNVEAQRHISQVVQRLMENPQVGLVALEGTSDSISLKTLQSYPDQLVVRKVGDYLLENNRISGPVHAGMVAGLKRPAFTGIDDKTHYNRNVQAVRDATVFKKELSQLLDKKLNRLHHQKEQAFNADLLSFDRHVNAYRNATLTLSDYLKTLESLSTDSDPLFQTYIEAASLESTLNFAKVESERSFFIKNLLEKLNEQERTRLFQISVAFHEGRLTHHDFYDYLKTICEKKAFPLHHYKELNSYIQYVLLAASIDPEKLFEAIELAETAVTQQLCSTVQEKNLVRDGKYLYLARKLVDFSLTADEWKVYKALRTEVAAIKIPHLNVGSSQNYLKSFERFYDEAEIRDHRMALNTAKAMTQQKTNTAILVTGGFHTEGITAELNKKGITVLTFAPKITKVDGTQASAYLGIFSQEKTPLEQLFDGEKLFLSTDPKLGLVHTPGLVALLSRFRNSVLSPLQSFKSIAPQADVQEVSVSLTGKTEGTATIVTSDNKAVVSQVSVNTNLDILDYMTRVRTNSNFWSLLLSGVLSVSAEALGSRVDSLGFIQLFFLVKTVLMLSVVVEEGLQMAADGQLSRKNLDESLMHVLSAFKFADAKKDSPFIYAVKFALAFLSGSDLRHASFEVTSKEKSDIRWVGAMGFVSHVSLMSLGLALLQFPSARPTAFVLMAVNLFLFIGGTLRGGDREMLLTGLKTIAECGVFGFHARRKVNERYIFNPDRFKNWMERKGQFTQIRGAQSAGKMKSAVMPYKLKLGWMLNPSKIKVTLLTILLIAAGHFSLPSVSGLPIEGFVKNGTNLRELPEAQRVVQIGAKDLNSRRGELIKRLMKVDEILQEAAELSGYKPVMDQESQSGHTRYATGSKTVLKNAHPHGSKPRLAKQLVRTIDGVKEIVFVLQNRQLHNGDMNGVKSPKIKIRMGDEVIEKPVWKIFEEEADTDAMRVYLEKVFGEKIFADGDSPVGAVLIDFLITQGMWYQSARLAYQMVAAKTIDEPAPAEADLMNVKFLVEKAFEKHKKQLYPRDEKVIDSDISQINKAAIPAFLADVQKSLRGFKTLTSTWSETQIVDFSEVMLQTFLYNDASQAVKFMFAMDSGTNTFGLNVDSTQKYWEKVITAHNKLPMCIVYDPTQDVYFFDSDHNSAKSNANFEKSKILYLLQENREVATLTLNGIRIYSNILRRELTPAEIEKRWHPLKNSPYAKEPDTSHVDDELMHDINRIGDELNRIHRSWDPKAKNVYDERNIKTANHLIDLLKEKNAEIGLQLQLKAEKKQLLIPERPVTPDLLMVGVENSFTTLDEWGKTMKRRFFPNLNISAINANAFNKAWKDPDQRQTLVGQNTIVVVMSMSGLTLMSLDSTEVAKNIKGRKKAIEFDIATLLSQFTEAQQLTIIKSAHGILNPGPDRDKIELKENHPISEAIQKLVMLLEDETKLTQEQDILEALSFVHQMQHSNGVREVITVTEEWDNEMTRANGLDLNKKDPPNNIFAMGGAKARVEAATLSADKGIQFMTELMLYMVDEFEKSKGARHLGFKTTREQIDRLKANNTYMLEQGIPLLIGKLPGGKSTVQSEARDQILDKSIHMANNFYESMKIDVGWKAYVWFAVSFGLSPFTGILPKLTSQLFEMFPPLWVMSGSLIVMGALVLSALTIRGQKWQKTWKAHLFYPWVITAVLVMFILPASLVQLTMPGLTVPPLLLRMSDATFFITGYYIAMVLHRIKEGRDWKARIHGNRVLFLTDSDGVNQYLHVYVGKLFSLAFGHIGINLQHGDVTEEALMRQSHLLPRGTQVYAGLPDGRREAAFKERQGETAMGSRQILYTMNPSLGAGPEVFAVGNNPKMFNFQHKIILPSSDYDLQQDEASDNNVHLNNIIEERFLRLQRLVAGQVFFAHMYQSMTSRMPWVKWPPHTQNNSVVLTTASPLNPIPSDKSLAPRDLTKIAQELVRRSRADEITAWIPGGLGSYFDAIVYDADGPNAGVPSALDSSRKAHYDETPHFATNGHMPETNGKALGKNGKKEKPTKLELEPAKTMTADSASSEIGKPEETVSADHESQSVKGRTWTKWSTMTLLWLTTAGLLYFGVRYFPTEQVKNFGATSYQTVSTKASEGIAFFKGLFPEKKKPTNIVAMVEQPFKLVTTNQSSSVNYTPAPKATTNENFTVITRLMAEKKGLEIKLLNISNNPQDPEVIATKKRLQEITDQIKDLTPKPLGSVQTPKTNSVNSNRYDLLQETVTNGVRSGALPSKMSNDIVNILGDTSLNLQVNEFNRSAAYSSYEAYLQKAAQERDPLIKALHLSYLSAFFGKLKDRPWMDLKTVLALQSMDETHPMKGVIFNIGEKPGETDRDLKVAQWLLSQSQDDEVSIDIVLALHGSEVQQQAITTKLSRFSGFHKKNVTVVREGKDFDGNGDIPTRGLLQAAVKSAGKELPVLSSVLSGQFDKDTARVILVSKFPARFSADEKLNDMIDRIISFADQAANFTSREVEDIVKRAIIDGQQL